MEKTQSKPEGWQGEDPRKAGRRTEKQLKFQKRNSIVLYDGLNSTLLPDLVANLATSSRIYNK